MVGMDWAWNRLGPGLWVRAIQSVPEDTKLEDGARIPTGRESMGSREAESLGTPAPDPLQRLAEMGCSSRTYVAVR
jgi:hypothetical protein